MWIIGRRYASGYRVRIESPRSLNLSEYRENDKRWRSGISGRFPQLGSLVGCDLVHLSDYWYQQGLPPWPHNSGGR
jgi:hypothetical protein